jgi:hypothetical protein
MTNAIIFDISADRIAHNRKPGGSFHVRRFSNRADAERYLDELFASKAIKLGTSRANAGRYARPGL